MLPGGGTTLLPKPNISLLSTALAWKPESGLRRREMSRGKGLYFRFAEFNKLEKKCIPWDNCEHV